jgi:RNA polymerase sigma-70 factor (ECF subfamily)
MSAERIAGAFLTTPAAMGRRLSRAKARLRASGARFAQPAPGETDDAMMAPALAAIYAAFGAGWAAVGPGMDGDGAGLAEEALWLGRVAAAAAPLSAEAQGLLALMLYVAGRAPARRDAHGAYVALDDQDRGRWSMAMLSEAETTLARAAGLGAPGRFQTEAAIQSAHLHRLNGGGGDWRGVLALYAALAVQAPSVGGAVAHAAALTASGRPEAALAMLDAIAAPATHQPWWACRAATLAALDRREDADAAYARAIGLTADPATADWLNLRRQILKVSSTSTTTTATIV